MSNDDPAVSVFRLDPTDSPVDGKSMALIGRTPSLWVHKKVYHEGGENRPHTHTDEDHVFIVLQGRATFRIGETRTETIEAPGGILLGSGAVYSFTNSGSLPLEIVRVGAPSGSPRGAPDTGRSPGDEGGRQWAFPPQMMNRHFPKPR